MKIFELIEEEKNLLNLENDYMSLSDRIRLKKISEVTSLYFDTLCSYSKKHSIEELKRYKTKLDEEDICF